VELRELTGALLRRLRTSMRELRDKRDSCSFKRARRAGAINRSTPKHGAMVKLIELKTSKPSMISLSTRDQQRPPGNSKVPLQPHHRLQKWNH